MLIVGVFFSKDNVVGFLIFTDNLFNLKLNHWDMFGYFNVNSSIENIQFLIFKEQVGVVGKHDEFSYFECINDFLYKKNE